MTNFSSALDAIIAVLWDLVKVGGIVLLLLIILKIAFNVLSNKNPWRKGGERK